MHEVRAVVAPLWTLVSLSLLSATMACRSEPDLTLQPDSLLQAELGLTVEDRVYRVDVTGGEVERAEPAALSIEAGSYVQFVTTDWLVHEILFDTTALNPSQRGFLRATDQLHSPPLIDRGSRYVLSFVDAPPGSYTYRLEGNGTASRGTIVVAASEGGGGGR
jgi:plastocyanin